MPMRATTVRFGEDLWALLEREARATGVSAAQFVREATILRLAMLAGLRGDPEAQMSLAAIAANAARQGNGSAAVADAVAEAVADPRRVEALQSSGLLDSPPEERFDGLARLAARLLNAPVALVSLVDRDRQFFKSCLGLPEPWASRREVPLSHSFCKHTLVEKQPLIVTDAREHPELRENLAIRDLDVIAYAGIPLKNRGGQVLGTLCVIDDQPRQWSDEEISLLNDVAAAVTAQIQ